MLVAGNVLAASNLPPNCQAVVDQVSLSHASISLAPTFCWQIAVVKERIQEDI
jgi:hypothetical protein